MILDAGRAFQFFSAAAPTAVGSGDLLDCLFVFPAIIDGVPKQRRNRCILRLSIGANLDMAQTLSGSFEEMSRVPERCPVVKSEVYVRALNSDISVMFGHLFWSHAEAGDPLPQPHHLNKVLVQ